MRTARPSPSAPATGSKLRPRRTRGKGAAGSRAQENDTPAKRRNGESGGNSPTRRREIGRPGEPADAAESERFIAEFTSHWRLHGKAAFDAVCSKDPARYLALAAKLIGRDGERRADKNDLVALLAGLERD